MQSIIFLVIIPPMFVISERHVDMVIKQAFDNYPYETGGAFIGEGTTIKGVLPLFNLADGDQKKQFGITSDDLIRAHDFAKKHGLSFLGFYHTHPKGVAYPSDADLSHNQKHLFIISLRNQGAPDFRAFTISSGRHIVEDEIIVMSNDNIQVVDIQTGKVAAKINKFLAEQEKLNKLVSDIVEENINYPKNEPRDNFEAQDSSFNTEA